MKFLVPCAVFACLLLSACSGDDSTESTAAEAESQSLDDAIAKINDAIDAGDCATVAQIVNRTTSGLYENADDPPKELCKSYEENFVPALEEVDFDRSQQFGPAAIIEGEPPSNDKEAAVYVAVLLRDPYADDDWTYTYGNGDTLEQIDTEPVDPEGVEETAQGFMDAVADQDCDALADLIQPTTNAFPGGDPKELCSTYFNGPFGKAYADGANLELLGGTIDYSFFEVTPEDGSRTDTMILYIVGDSEDGKMGVVDVLPTPAEG